MSEPVGAGIEVRAGHRVALFTALGVAGLLARCVVAAGSIGSNDADIWLHHARNVGANGVCGALLTDLNYNHPPLTAWWAVLCGLLSGGDLYRFSLGMKVPTLLAEVGSALLIRSLWRRRAGAEAGAKAFALYGWSLVAILVSAFHCNTDALLACFALAAMDSLDRERPLSAGLWLAAAVNVKVSALILLPAALIPLRDRRQLLRFGLGLSAAALPFLPLLASCPGPLYRNMFLYNSNPGNWGVPGFINAARGQRYDAWVRAVAEAYLPRGRWVILGLISAVAWVQRRRRTWSAVELGAIAMAIFLVFTPGFGPQYLIWGAPLLAAADPRRGLLYGTVAGIFALSDYLAASLSGPPYRAVFFQLSPPIATELGVLAWACLVAYLAKQGARLGSEARQGAASGRGSTAVG